MDVLSNVALSMAISYAERFSDVLAPQIRRDIALGQIVIWARQQDNGASERLASKVIEMGDKIVSHYSGL